MPRLLATIGALMLLAGSAAAQALTVVPVTEGTFAIVGPLSQRDPDNLGNNATFGLVVTGEGAVLIDAGASTRGAAALHEVIKGITDQPVVTVINTGGQDHRWLGNGYWAAQGAQIIASNDAVADQQDRASAQLSLLAALIGPEALAGTEPHYADVTFADDYAFELGGVQFMLVHPGAAHTPGDSFVWLADRAVMFTGDIVYVERILGVGPQSDSRQWVDSFAALAALAPRHVVPGHGHPTDLAGARADTYDYLVNLRQKIGALIEAGGDILDAPKVDQSAFSDLVNFEGLAGRNAQEVYSQMEWE